MSARDRRMLAAAERLAAAILADRAAGAAYVAGQSMEGHVRSMVMGAAVATQRAAALEVGRAHEEIVRTSRLRHQWRTDDGQRAPAVAAEPTRNWR